MRLHWHRWAIWRLPHGENPDAGPVVARSCRRCGAVDVRPATATRQWTPLDPQNAEHRALLRIVGYDYRLGAEPSMAITAAAELATQAVTDAR